MTKPVRKNRVSEVFEDFFSRFRVTENDSVVVALSWGSDSVALLLASVESFGCGRVVAAHFNHRLRGAESDADQAFCEALCERLGVRLEVGSADVSADAKERKTGTEDSARTLRYSFLRSVAERGGARFVLTGHTADDQAETVLMNFLRWSKLAWLSWIPESSGAGTLRPFLELWKNELLSYLLSNNQDYREDSSNLDAAYLRNRLRLNVVPEIETFNPGFAKTMSRFARYAKELDAHVGGEVAEYLENQEPPNSFDVSEFSELSEFFRKEILSRLYAKHNGGTVWLSEGTVREMLAFSSLRYGGKSKTFGALELVRKKWRISYWKNRED